MFDNACSLVGGWLHIHANVKDEDKSSWITTTQQKFVELLAQSKELDWVVHVQHVEHVKWYAPHIQHVVLDLELRPVKPQSDACPPSYLVAVQDHNSNTELTERCGGNQVSMQEQDLVTDECIVTSVDCDKVQCSHLLKRIGHQVKGQEVVTFQEMDKSTFQETITASRQPVVIKGMAVISDVFC